VGEAAPPGRREGVRARAAAGSGSGLAQALRLPAPRCGGVVHAPSRPRAAAPGEGERAPRARDAASDAGAHAPRIAADGAARERVTTHGTRRALNRRGENTVAGQRRAWLVTRVKECVRGSLRCGDARGVASAVSRRRRPAGAGRACVPAWCLPNRAPALSEAMAFTVLGMRAAPRAAAASRRAPPCAPSASVRPPLRAAAACRVEASASFGPAAPRSARAAPRGSRLTVSAGGDEDVPAAPAAPADEQLALDDGAGGDDGSSGSGSGGGGGGGGGDGEEEAEDAEPLISLAEARAACVSRWRLHCASHMRVGFFG
jgi:uncharacterized membrane protein YgcG